MTSLLPEAFGNIDAELAILTASDRNQLISIWQARWSDPPPLILLAPKLRRLIAYRLQLAHEHARRGSRAQSPADSTESMTEAPMIFRRTWKGVEHEVVRVSAGFLHRGKTYRSLSAVARAITGTRWNGLVFFSATHLGGAARRRLAR